MDLTKRRLKTRYPIASTLSIDVYEKLDKFSKDTKTEKSKILDAALKEYFENIEKEGE